MKRFLLYFVGVIRRMLSVAFRGVFRGVFRWGDALGRFVTCFVRCFVDCFLGCLVECFVGRFVGCFALCFVKRLGARHSAAQRSPWHGAITIDIFFTATAHRLMQVS